MSELSNPYAARPAFAVGDRVELWDDKDGWSAGTVLRVYRSANRQGIDMWVYDVAMDFMPELPIHGVTHARKAQP